MLQIAEYGSQALYTNGAFSVLHACLGILTADHVLPAHAQIGKHR